MQVIKGGGGGDFDIDEEARDILGVEEEESVYEKEESLPLKYIFFDFECTQEDKLDNGGGYLHVPNYCVAHRVCSNCIDNETIGQDCDTCGKREHVFAGKDTQKEFCQWLLSPKNKGTTAIAHNMKGYDGHFILGPHERRRLVSRRCDERRQADEHRHKRKSQEQEKERRHDSGLSIRATSFRLHCHLFPRRSA